MFYKKMRYEKGSYILIPNKDLLKGKSPLFQVVFMWICQFADEDGICFPSRKKLAEVTGSSVKSIDRAIKELTDSKLLEKTTRKKGIQNLSNVYQIIIGGSDNMTPPRDKNDTTPRDKNDTVTNTNINYNHLTISKSEDLRDNIQPLIKLFEKVNPTYETIYSNKTQRSALTRLVKKFGVEKMTNMLNALPEIINKPYAPKVTTPLELERDLGKIILFKKQESLITKQKPIMKNPSEMSPSELRRLVQS